MLIIQIPIKFDRNIDIDDLYRLYATNLPRFKKQILLNCNKYSIKQLSHKIINSPEIDFNDNVNDDTVYKDILVSVVNNLGIYINRYGNVNYQIRKGAHNKFAKNVSLDYLARVIEYGNSQVKSTNIFHNSIQSLAPFIQKVYNLTYKPNVLK